MKMKTFNNYLERIHIHAEEYAFIVMTKTQLIHHKVQNRIKN